MGLKYYMMKEITIHFDRAFAILREEYGMPMKMESLSGSLLAEESEIETMSNNGTIEKSEEDEEVNREGEVSSLASDPNIAHLPQDAEGYPIKQFGQGELNVDEFTTNLKNKYLNYAKYDVELSDEEKWYVRRINLKLDYDTKLDKEEIDRDFIFRLYLYRIITRRKMLDYINHGKYADTGFDFNEAEYRVIGKVLDNEMKPTTSAEIDLLQQYKIHGISKIAEKEAALKRKQNKPLIQGNPNGQFTDRKLFDSIAKPDLKTIDLRNAASHISEFREEFIKAITPGEEGKLKFRIGVLSKKDLGGSALLSIKFTATQRGAYADVQAKTYSRPGHDKLMPTNLRPVVYTHGKDKRTGKKEKQHSLAARGGQSLWYEGIPNALMFLHYLKKQLYRLQKMVMPHV